MSETHKIKCINKSNGFSAHERITHVGGTNNGHGTRWKFTLDKAIEEIESGRCRFYVSVNGEPVPVIVSTSESGHKYLKTQNDDKQPNDLLSLSECP